MPSRLATALAAIPFAATLAAADPAATFATADPDGCGMSRADWIGHFVQAGGQIIDIRADRSATVEGRPYHLMLLRWRENFGQHLIGDQGIGPALNLTPQCDDVTKPSRVTSFTYVSRDAHTPTDPFVRTEGAADKCDARVKDTAGARLYRYQDHGLMSGYAMKPVEARMTYATCVTEFGRTLAGDFRYQQPAGDTPLYNRVTWGGRKQTFYRLLEAGEQSYRESRLFLRDADLARCPSAECDRLARWAAQHGKR
ncbi:hypothetical protein [Nonomuraea jiangxiensis]|uniref:Uncharacterized protein n=1 Tax=Nonomuraea jiangxiensis TaxID=633440 RepID=A0A1G9G619_9ACTN|nr:hypothetical protein [Nonomuraea jiangxiensis]SDK96017.1 hypothetical protein SAMN05421869_120185 [Nonomuraea jiangxiensis]